jgi:hypothetical protein
MLLDHVGWHALKHSNRPLDSLGQAISVAGGLAFGDSPQILDFFARSVRQQLARSQYVPVHAASAPKVANPASLASCAPLGGGVRMSRALGCSRILAEFQQRRKV